MPAAGRCHAAAVYRPADVARRHLRKVYTGSC